jgi:hypothetical protein
MSTCYKVAGAPVKNGCNRAGLVVAEEGMGCSSSASWNHTISEASFNWPSGPTALSDIVAYSE